MHSSKFIDSLCGHFGKGFKSSDSNTNFLVFIFQIDIMFAI